jgi:hypothetical protein
MTQLREIAYLELDTFSLAGTGNINANFSQWTYKNIDLKAVMGPMWDKYNKFIIKMQQISTNGTLTYGSGSSAGSFSYNLAGLDWINLYYEAGQSNQRFAPVANIQISTGAPNQTYILPNPSVGFNFRKGQQIVDLEFRIYPIGNTNFNVVTSDTYNNNQMTFTIEPAEDNENEMGAMILNTNNSITTSGKTSTSNNNIITYTNFNIKDVCREFWDKYEDFEIIYSSFTSIGLGAATTTQLQQPVAVKGFDYLNNYMGTGSGNFETDTTLLGINKYGAASTHTFDYMMPSRAQFKKSGSTMVLQLQFKNFDNNGINSFTSISNRRIQMSFFIKPIRKDLGCCDKGTLILSGAGMTTTDAIFGVTNATQTNTTWRNISLRSACRGFWDKYKKFNIFLNQCVCNPTNTTASNQCLMLYMKGLNFETPWTNDTSIDSQTWTIGGVTFGHTITTPAIFEVSNGNTRGIMFNKSKDVVDINMFVKTIDGTALASTGALNGTYIFTIVPVEEE